MTINWEQERLEQARLDAKVLTYWYDEMSKEHREPITAMMEKLGLWSITVNKSGKITGINQSGRM